MHCCNPFNTPAGVQCSSKSCATLDCADFVSAVAPAILELANTQGALAPEVVAQMLVLCPGASEESAVAALSTAASRGIVSIKRNAAGNCVYFVNANMCGVNPSNSAYARKFCELWSG